MTRTRTGTEIINFDHTDSQMTARDVDAATQKEDATAQKEGAAAAQKEDPTAQKEDAAARKLNAAASECIIEMPAPKRPLEVYGNFLILAISCTHLIFFKIKDIKYITKLIGENQIQFNYTPEGDIGRHYKKHFESRFRSMGYNGEMLPSIQCKDCSKVFLMYKWSDKKNGVYTNTASNILNHAKCTVRFYNQPTIDIFKPHALTPSLRDAFCNLYADIISQHPTISVKSGVEIMNSVANFASKIAMQHSKTYDIDVSRKLVGKKIIDNGKEQARKNRDYFAKNYENSSMVIDHWSKAGSNFLGVIGRTIKEDYSVNEYLLHFTPASDDKSGDGIHSQVVSLLPQSNICLPVISDNCPSMIAALSGYKNKAKRTQVCKVFCIEHYLAKVDEAIHRLKMVKDLEKTINEIDSFFNYRDKK